MARPRFVTPRRRTALGSAALLVAATLTWMTVSPDAAVGASAPLPSDCVPDSATPARVDCTYTAVGEHTFTVPAGIASLEIVAVGASGGDFLPGDAPFTRYDGGAGGTASGIYQVPPGTTTLYAEVGGVGMNGNGDVQAGSPEPTGGYNGGGKGSIGTFQRPYGSTGAGGGGGSDVRTVSVAQRPNSAITDDSNDPRLLSGAGGGGGQPYGAGGAAGQPGVGPVTPNAQPGTATAGGFGGGNFTPTHVDDGTRVSGGGQHYASGAFAGAGGGGGWYGGGAGIYGSGAGGSNFVTPALTASSTGASAGAAEVEISYTRVAPTVAATAGATGTTASDSATVTGTGAIGQPGGTITFSLFAPSDTTCTGTPLYTVTNAVVPGSGNSATASASQNVIGSGDFHWIVSYSGDGSYAPAGTACNAPGQTSTVAGVKGTPTLSTQASPSTGPHGVANDHATLSGGTAPYDGTVTFTLYAGDDPTCTGTPVGTDTANVDATGGAQSSLITVGKAGVYHWTAAYDGGTSNNPVTEKCGATDETTTVGTVTTIRTQATATGVYEVAGVQDEAFLQGSSPTGTVTFAAYGPNDPTCAGPPRATDTESVINSGGSFANSASINLPAGTYLWIASYSGDDRNTPVSGACGDPGEQTVVSPRPTTITTQATSATVGGSIQDTATLQGVLSAKVSSVTFSVFGPDSATCDPSTLVGSSAIAAVGNGNYTSLPVTVTKPGSYRWIAAYQGDGNNAPSTGACGDANETSVVTAATAGLTTAATNATVGGTIHDTATVTGTSPSGAVTFRVFAPADTTCGTALQTSVVALSGGKATSPDVTATQVGTYRWIASYAGDADNAPVTGACNDTGEASSVSKTAPTLSTAATAGTVGGTITDTATLTGLYQPTGLVTFSVYAPTDTTCTSAVATSSGTLTNGTTSSVTFTSSAMFTPTTTGTYRWIASYPGDANNQASSGACNDSGESSAVAQATPALSSAAAGGSFGGSITDTATVSGGYGPGGSVTFSVYAPGDTSCTTPVDTSVVPLSGGTATSTAYTATAVGTYRWIARYGGDANNAPVSGTCGDPTELSVVGRATPTLSSTATGGTVGGSITDTATLTGGYLPSGYVTFLVYAPSDPLCQGAQLAALHGKLAADGTSETVQFTPTQAGSYHWVALYPGDSDNAPVMGHCGDTGETSAVGLASPTLTTTATASTTAGGQARDVATVAGGSSPTGTVTFRLYGPDDTDCSGAVVNTDVVTLTGGTATAVLLVGPAGDYRWTADYSGDASNAQIVEGCNGAGETTTVTPTQALLSTLATTSTTAGGTAVDVATVTGYQPGGTVTFSLYGAGDTTCAGPVIGNDTEHLVGGVATSTALPVRGAGSYRWTASYSGDGNNKAALEECNGSGETTTVSATTPTVTTVADLNATAGGTARDTATVTGYQPTGIVRFDLYGPTDPSCTAAPVATSSVSLSGGQATSLPMPVAHAGEYHWTAAYLPNGDPNNVAVTEPCGDVHEATTVARAPSQLSTLAMNVTTAGGSANDTATVVGLAPTGTVTFSLFGPGDTTCTGTALATDVQALPSGTSGRKDVGSSLVPLGGVGTYRWSAHYSGDADNAPADDGCGVPGETTIVDATSPSITTSADASVVYGHRLRDTATLTGTYQASGTITFTLYAGTQCTDPVRSGKVTVVAGTQQYSVDLATVAPGTYHWQAVYSGDTNNFPAKDACDESTEQVMVTRAPVMIDTHADPSTPAGGTATDTASVTGPAPTGKVTFTLYGPGDTTCSGTPVGTDVEKVGTDGTATSQPITVGAVGDYRWVASYDGDAYTLPGTATCNAAGETTTVGQATVGLATQAADGAVGGTIADTATLTGGYEPTGTVTFTVYAPGDTDCSGDALATSTATVSGDGTVMSAAVPVSHVGDYRWEASYSGDLSNVAVAGTCGDAAETSTVDQQAPTFGAHAAPRQATVGQALTDVATLAGDPPTGTITFRLFGNAGCAGAAVATVSVTVAGSGTFTSPTVTATRAGTYRWVASYSGDADHLPAATDCGDAAQAVLVAARSVPGSPTTPAAPTHGNDDQSLSVTGTPTASLLLLGLLLLLAGAGVVTVARRRNGRRA